MAYEVFQRTGVRVEEPTLSITPDGRMVLNAAGTRILNQAAVRYVLLLWDQSNAKIALKSTSKGDRNAYAVSLVSNKHSGSLRAKSFLSYIGWRAPQREILPATWNEKEKTLEITIPRKHVRSEK